MPTLSPDTSLTAAQGRETCLRCYRPGDYCYCALIQTLATRTRLVFLQHPREARVAIGTARMAHLTLPNSELHEGVSFAGHARVEAVAALPGAALLFPGEGARTVAELATPPTHLVVLDGTWPQARKMFNENAILQRLPRIGFTPRQPGNYRIRREPTADSLATIEAVSEVLGDLEGQPETFRQMLRAFEVMIDRQIAAAAARTEPPRHRLRERGPWWRATALAALARDPSKLIVLHAEANAHRLGSGVDGEPELVHLVAERPWTGARFEAFLAPRRPLAPGAASHLEIPATQLLAGEPVAPALERWRAFIEDGILFGWGHFALDLLAAEGEPPRPFEDLRLLVAQKLHRRPGAPAAVARGFGIEVEPSQAAGRAGRVVAASSAVLRALVAELQPA